MIRAIKGTLATLLGTGLLLVLALVWLRRLPTERLPLPDQLVALESPQGQALLEGGLHRDFDALTPYLQTQEGPTYCGVASSVSVLNALSSDSSHLSQDTLLSAEALGTPPGWKVWLRGMTLNELGQILTSHGATPTVYHGDSVTLDGFRGELARNAANPSDFLIINYSRSALSQEGGGHISPVAAYNGDSDQALIMDVATYKYPPVWVDVPLLFAAMGTIDPSVDKPRGYVVVSAEH